MSDSENDDEPIAVMLARSKAAADKGGQAQTTVGPSSAKPKEKPAAKPKATKAEPKQPKTEKGSKAEKNGKAPVLKRERKQYDLPGQTRDTPDEADPLRKFYTSLREQRPDSQMARKWLMQMGLLPEEEAAAAYEELRNVKSPAKPTRSAKSTQRGPRKRKADDEAKRPTKRRPKQAAPKHAKKDAADSAEEEDEEDSDDDDLVDTTRRKPTKKPAARKPAAKKDVAFDDGGLSSDSEDEKPLNLRKAIAAG